MAAGAFWCGRAKQGVNFVRRMSSCAASGPSPSADFCRSSSASDSRIWQWRRGLGEAGILDRFPLQLQRGSSTFDATQWSRWRCFSSASSAAAGAPEKDQKIELALYPPPLVRNFSIIAHVDHGKSTLADRLLELTGTIRKGHGQPQFLDKLQVERERGITVKAQTATMFYNYSSEGSSLPNATESQRYLLNLIDTPGHVDFSYEVSRSLAACQGVLLLVDACQGVQAQTVANFYLAFEAELSIIPVINKIDQPNADPERVKGQLKAIFDIDPEDVLLTSAKTGEGLSHILPAVIERIPQPKGLPGAPLRMLLLDAYYDDYKGVVCHVAVVDGALKKGDKIASAASGQSYDVTDVGILYPELTPTSTLFTGQVGYVVTGMRTTKEARVGDTLHHVRFPVQPLPGKISSTILQNVSSTSRMAASLRSWGLADVESEHRESSVSVRK